MGSLNQSGSKLSGSAGGGGSALTSTRKQKFTATVGQTQFTVTDFTVNATNAKAYVGSNWMNNPEDFSVSGNVFTFTMAMLGGEIVTLTN